MGGLSMADPESGFAKGRISKRYLSVWKVIGFRLLAAQQVIKSKLINKICFVVLLYQGIPRFCAIVGNFGDMAVFSPLGPAYEAHGPPPPLNTYRYVHRYLNNLRTTYPHIISKSACKFSPALANYITDSNKMFWGQSQGSLVDSYSDSWLIAMALGDSDSDSSPLV